MRLMLDLPRETHRRLIEPLSGVVHAKFLMMKRFLTFIQQIQNSKKQASIFLLQSISHDARSITGSNLRNILLLTKKSSIPELVPDDIAEMKYHEIPDNENWKISIIKELIEVKNRTLEVETFRMAEIDQVLEYLCVS